MDSGTKRSRFWLMTLFYAPHAKRTAALPTRRFHCEHAKHRSDCPAS
nr:MAG TPA: hypothetical protein [Caudoviricetes sp.]